jgi:hypothetical protein
VECDIWIIWGGLKHENETVICNPNNIIYLTDEVHSERLFNKKFLDQFAAIITCRTDLQHNNIIASHELNTWMIEKTFDEISAEKTFEKTKEISIICSDQTWLNGHKLRYAFVNKLMGHFKDKIDVFGRGFNPIIDKYNALAPYKYSVAIENSVIPGYFTEKIADCWLTHTMPLYYGCPNLNNYVPDNAFKWLDINNFKEALLTIESIIHNNTYQLALPNIVAAKNTYLQQLHIFNALPHLLTNNFTNFSQVKSCKIWAEYACERGYNLNKILSKILHKMPVKKSKIFKIEFLQKAATSNSK